MLSRTKTADNTAAGTIAYMAPEVLSGESASFASDLYAVGMMTYEILAGEHPFDLSNLSGLFQQMMSKVPDVEALDIHSDLTDALDKLLDKNPARRFQEARKVLEILDHVTDTPLQSEDALMRDSFLQSADFVGRAEEMETLLGALQYAREKQSTAWLIGGESGVGKSRLLDEIRTQAQVQGMVVMRGFSVEEVSAPYTVWREPLRFLALLSDVTEEEAQILQPLLPDIETLTGITIEKDETAYSRDRLYEVVTDLLRRQTHPMLLILEDLQWETDSIDLLRHLIPYMTDLPLVIMASYRDDEAPDLHLGLRNMTRMRLNRLSHDEIGDLSASMLGEDIGRKNELVELLEHESEGNVLFIVEVVRTLTEISGSMETIANATLPEEIFSGNIQKIVQRRLESLPEKTIGLLQIAAIAGRRVDLHVINELNPYNFSVNSWLVTCMDAAVLEIQEDQWRFSHDKLRTALIGMLEPDKKAAIHRKVATVLEAVTKTTGYQHHALIAYHWEQGESYEQALPHLTKAAEEALRDYANAHVVDYLSHAIYLDTHLKLKNPGSGTNKEEHAHWQRLLGEAMDVDGDNEAAKRHYEKLLRFLDPDGSGTSISQYSKMNMSTTMLTREQDDALHACNRLLNLYLYDGQWELAEKIITRMGTIYFEMGSQRNWLGTLVTTAWIEYFQGQFDKAEKGFKQSFIMGITRKLPTMLIAGGAGLIIVTMRRGSSKDDLEKALKDLENNLAKISEEPIDREKLLLDGTRGLVNLELGNVERARELTKSGLDLVNVTHEYQLFDLVAYTSLAETALELWESGYMDDTLQDDVVAASRALHLFAQIVPIARPRAWMYQARANWLTEDYKRAQRALNIAISEARSLHMPYDEGIAYYHLGRPGSRN